VHRVSWFIGILVAAVATIPDVSLAEEAGRAEVDVDGDGRPETVALRSRGDGQHVLVVDGVVSAHSVSSSLVGTGAAQLRSVDLGRGRRAAHYRVPLTGERLAFEAILSVARGGALSVAWAGVTGLRGDPGSRWGERVIVDDLTGEGHPSVLVASVAEEVPLCGVAEPELFPRALDPSTGQMRPVMLNRLRRMQTAETPLEVSSANPGTLTPTPALEVASFAVASTIVGDRGVVEGLAAPRALVDGDRSTSWVEGRPGPGTGEFVTARLLPGPYRVRAVALTLAPAPGGQSPAAGLGRLRTFSLLLEGASGVRRYRVTVPTDPAGAPGVPVWVLLPEPVQASCLSLVLGEVYGSGRGAAAAPPSSTAVSEVEIYTDLDFEGGPELLLAALREGTADVEVALRALGARAVPLLQEPWSDLDTAARRRAIRVLASLEDPAAAPLLVEAALGTDPGAAEQARAGLVTLGAQALPALTVPLEATDAAQRASAAQIIGDIGTVEAIELLARRLSASPPPPEPDVRGLRRALGRALERAGQPGRDSVLGFAEEAHGRARQALLAVLAPAAPAEQERFARLVIDGWERATTFEDRFRLLTIAAGAGRNEALLRMAAEALRDPGDRYLRAHAAVTLGRMGHEAGVASEVVGPLAAAARDEWTGVRLAVATALGLVDPAVSRAALSGLLGDPWPVVRAAAATSVARAGVGGGALPLLVTALADRSPLVQANAAHLLGELGTPEALAPLRELAEDEDRPVESRQAAARAIGALCSSDAEATLVELLDSGAEGRPSPADTRVAAAAASALARFGSVEIGQRLVSAARGGPAGLRLAAIEALGQGRHPGAREALEALTEDPLAPLRAAAAAALRRLGEAEVGEREPECPR
jgi:HEAT repeat protein